MLQFRLKHCFVSHRQVIERFFEDGTSSFVRFFMIMIQENIDQVWVLNVIIADLFKTGICEI